MMRRMLVLLFFISSACEAPPEAPPEIPVMVEPAPAEPEPGEPEPVEPEPVEPEPGEPEPVEPEPAEPEPVEPEPAEPEPVEPEPAEPEPAEPEPAALECRAQDLGAAENQLESGHYRLMTDTWDVPINGLCPVSDFSITHGPDAVFTYTALDTGLHYFSTVGRGINGLSLHAGCDRDAPLLCAIPPHYHDPDLGNRPLDLRWEMQAGETVYVFVDGFRTDQVGVEVIVPVGEGAACGYTVCPENGRCPAIDCGVGTRCFEATCQVPPPPVGVGAECNWFARCDADLLCLDARCVVPPEPEVVEFWATWHAGRLFVEATVYDPAEALEAPELNVGAFVNRGFNSRGRHRWSIENALVEAMPATARIVGDGRVIAEIDVVAQPEVAVGEVCHRFSGLDRCTLGSLCLGDDGDTRCVAADARAWRVPGQDDAVIVDIEAPGLTNQERLQSNGFFDVVALDADRWVGRQLHDGAATISIWHGVDLFALDVPVVDPPDRRVGEACDPARVADLCAQTSACIRGACEVVQGPVIHEAIYVKTQRAIGIWVRGSDPNHDVVSLEIDSYDAAFDPAIRSMWWTSSLTWDGDQFEGWLSDDAGWRTRNWRDAELVLVDAEGWRSAPFALDPTLIQDRATGEAGAACDRIGGLFPCAEGLICDTRDDAVGPLTCRVLDVACDADLDAPIALDQLLSIDAPGATNQTRVTCDRFVRDLPEHRLRFVPDAPGRFVAQVVSNQVFGLAARRGCHLPLSEIACAEQFDRGQPLDGGFGHGVVGEMVFDADAGQQITLLVDGADRFNISVRRQ